MINYISNKIIPFCEQFSMIIIMCSFNKIHHLSEILESLHFKHTHSLLEYIYVKKNFQKFFYWLRW